MEADDVACLQLRLKNPDGSPAPDDAIRSTAALLQPIAQKNGVDFLLNDAVHLAEQLPCDGVHIGQSDTPCKEARARLGENKIIGITCHDSRHLALEAGEAGADYVAFGAFFPTTTKPTKYRPAPSLLDWWQTMTQIPCVAIGGITPENAAPLIKAGADFIAVSAAVWTHPQGAGEAVRLFNKIFDDAS